MDKYITTDYPKVIDKYSESVVTYFVHISYCVPPCMVS